MNSKLLFQHIDHTLTRPTLLAGPDGCGKTQYARQVLTTEGFDIIEVAGDADLLECLEGVTCGKGFGPRAVIITEFEMVIKDRNLNWKKLTEMLLKLTKKRVPTFAIADWCLNSQGQPSQRYPPDLKKLFYIVTVRPPSPAQISEIVHKRKSGLTSPECSKIANECCGDVRHALITTNNKLKTLKDMHINSDVDDRLSILMSNKNKYSDDLLDLSMLALLFDNYHNLPLTFEKCCNITQNFSICDIFISSQENQLAYAVIQQICQSLSSGGKNWASKFMASKRDNTTSLVANRQKLLRTERNKLLLYSSNVTLDYLMTLPLLLSDLKEYDMTSQRLEKLAFRKSKHKK